MGWINLNEEKVDPKSHEYTCKLMINMKFLQRPGKLATNLVQKSTTTFKVNSSQISSYISYREWRATVLINISVIHNCFNFKMNKKMLEMYQV